MYINVQTPADDLQEMTALPMPANTGLCYYVDLLFSINRRN